MIKIRKSQNTPVVVIRAASERELATYEKNKLVKYVQENIIKVTKVNNKHTTAEIETNRSN